ncbi:arsenate reductase ArsC [Asticcacaulis sp.]|uniref:arsenate reductase ArsC n=1 Tax=Asticcacaulis sp. TaxID=1872648 RepID=UPI0031D7885D
MSKPYNVLFICTQNSARSILAEAIVNTSGQGRFRAWSAGSRPSGSVNPHALALLNNLGIDTAFARSKSWHDFATEDAPKFDFVFTVCDQAALEPCPMWSGSPLSGNWNIPDPAVVTGTEAEIGLAFSDTFRLLQNRIHLFMNLPVESLDRISLQKRVDDIGKA